MDRISTSAPRRQAARWTLAALGLPWLAQLSACSGFLGPRTVTISREELLAKLGKRFPTSRRVMNLLDVQAAVPELTLLPDQNRIKAVVPLSASDMLMGQRYRGAIGLSFGLRYEPQDLSIRLTQTKVEDVSLDGLPAAARQQLTKLGAWLAEEKLQDAIVHQFKPDELRTADRMGYEVGGIRVTAAGLAVDLTPRR